MIREALEILFVPRPLTLRGVMRIMKRELPPGHEGG